MRLRRIAADMDTDVVARLDLMLAEIAHAHGVAIPLAVESGSRAWGFPSPDSDYDCRFLFVRPLAQVVSPWPRRDVIEAPADALLDVNGWDLGKALKLLLKGNAVILEWLTSPIVYDGDAWFHDALLGLARQMTIRQRVARHYLHLGERLRRTQFGDGESVPQKKIFYVLRPAAALRWLRLHPGQAIAPMHFPTLMTESAAPDDVRDLVQDLTARKAATRELGTARLPAPLAAFVDAEFAAARGLTDAPDDGDDDAARSAADAFHFAAVTRFDRSAATPYSRLV